MGTRRYPQKSAILANAGKASVKSQQYKARPDEGGTDWIAKADSVQHAAMGKVIPGPLALQILAGSRRGLPGFPHCHRWRQLLQRRLAAAGQRLEAIPIHGMVALDGNGNLTPKEKPRRVRAGLWGEFSNRLENLPWAHHHGCRACCCWRTTAPTAPMTAALAAAMMEMLIGS